MQILVQNCFTHLYLKSPTEWTPAVSEAKSFDTSEKALGFCLEHQIPEVQVVLKFDHDRYDVQVSITPECDDAAPSQSASRN
jgi:hypothetical protein